MISTQIVVKVVSPGGTGTSTVTLVIAIFGLCSPLRPSYGNGSVIDLEGLG